MALLLRLCLPALALTDCPSQIDNNTNYMGNDLPGLSDGWQVASHEECCSRCNAEPACLYYTFCNHCTCKNTPDAKPKGGCCHPKYAKPAKIAPTAPGRISGRPTTIHST